MIGLPRTPAANAARIQSAVGPLAAACRGRPVFLVDGDRTLTPDDTSRTFLSRAGLDPLVIKRRFQRDGYVFDAFRFHAEMHVALGEALFAELAPRVAADTLTHPGAIEFLHAATALGRVFVVSAGIPRIWRALLDRHGLDDVGVIGGVDPRNPYVFGRIEKAQVARLFLPHATRIVGLGDSEVDADMLRLSDHAVMVVNHHQNADLVPHLDRHPSLWQVVPSGAPHAGIPELAFSSVAALGERAPLSYAEASLCR
jgi:phosphoserine phosphatase